MDKYYTLLRAVCEKVKKIKNLDVSFYSMEFYGIHKYSEERVYKVNIIYKGEPLTIYPEEGALNHWGEVPCSGQTRFRPADFDNWSNEKKLFLAWCWAIYYYCKHMRHPAPPEILE